MFDKGKKAQNAIESHNMLSCDTVIEGDISTKDDMRFEGSIKGNISSDKKLVVGQMAIIEGNITCGSIDTHGKITGDIHCTDKVIIRANARLTGNVSAKTIEIEPGAFFEGSCRMHQ